MLKDEMEKLVQSHRSQLAVMNKEIELLRSELERSEYTKLHDAVARMDERIKTIEKLVEKQDSEIKRVTALEEKTNELKRQRDESDKRQWQFVYIFAGACASLLVTVIVQLVLAYFKR
jgi:hypothetical protein